MPSTLPRNARLRTAGSRLAITMVGAALVFALVGATWGSGLSSLLPRVLVPAVAAVSLFTLLERWPRRLPAALPRWLLQLVGVTAVVPVTVLAFYLATVQEGATPFWDQPERMFGFMLLSVLGMFVASWFAMGALMRRRDAAVREAHARELALQRQVADARLQLLESQVQPHFLFNTLANVQALVDAGSPRASTVLGSLVAYLRAAVPRLSDPGHSIGRELEMARAYLTLMQMRMPDRLAFDVDADPSLDGVACPPLTVMTLVENAVRHGIDPSVDGGRVDVCVRRIGDARLEASVGDTGAGLMGQGAGMGLGTGLTALRERLLAAFGDDASLRVVERPSGGVLATVELPMVRR